MDKSKAIRVAIPIGCVTLVVAVASWFILNGDDGQGSELVTSDELNSPAQQELTAESTNLELANATTLPPNPNTDEAQPEAQPIGMSEAENLELILNHPSRNTQFDDNKFLDVPMNNIKVSDLTVGEDLYNETLLDTSVSGYFRVKCEVSHFAYDDPIVFPQKPGHGHLHMFFGNTKTNAFSTYESLLNTGTGTCNGEDLNRTAYWVPAMLDADGNALIPWEIMVYYKNDNFDLYNTNITNNVFPDNLRMIAGNARATSPQNTVTGRPGSKPVISFSCGAPYREENVGRTIPDCSGQGNSLEMQIAFPACYSPSVGTYESDQSHTAYPPVGYYDPVCPDSHPINLSSIMYRIFFSVDDYGGSLNNLRLSSDIHHETVLPGGTTSHGDWFGAWHPETMKIWVENCNNTKDDCEIGIIDREPMTSLVQRKRNFYPKGHKVPAEQLIDLCPAKTLDKAKPLISVASCITP